MKYWQARKLSSREFKRLTGVKRPTFRLMVRLVKAQQKLKKKPGRPSNLIVEDRILVTPRKFSLPGKKKLLDSSLEDNLIVMDVMESPIEKPKKHQKGFYSGKQGEHTLKTQVVLEQKSEKIICLGHGKGRIHDFRLFKTSGVKEAELVKVIADKGYQGIAKIHGLSETPIKKPKGNKLTKQQKKYNRQLNRLRIVVEHVNRRLKIFKILSYRYRNRHRRFGLRSNLIAGIYNYEIIFTVNFLFGDRGLILKLKNQSIITILITEN
jgi:hypothetical protein